MKIGASGWHAVHQSLPQPSTILGSNKHMHTVIEPYCTGCELCFPCAQLTVFCLDIVNEAHLGLMNRLHLPKPAMSGAARSGWQGKPLKLDAQLEAKAHMKLADLEAHSMHTDPATLDKKRDVIAAAALERAAASSASDTASHSAEAVVEMKKPASFRLRAFRMPNGGFELAAPHRIKREILRISWDAIG